jgi:hypothetical protein
MVWFQVDDNLAFHPTVIEAGTAAMGLWFRAGAWSNANNTDGFIPARVADQLGTRATCNRLVKVGLFEPRPDGYQFCDWPMTATDSSAHTSNRQRHTSNRVRWLRVVPAIDPSTSHEGA